MKTLYLVRHAKSSWNFNELNDHDRPLSNRGRRDVRKMAMVLCKNVKATEQIMSSTASRAFYTALFMADHWGLSESQIDLHRTLFHADPLEILTLLRKFATYEVVAVFGHNPGFTDLANLFSNHYIENLPTCSAIGFNINIKHWSALTTQKAEPLFYYTPKNS